MGRSKKVADNLAVLTCIDERYVVQYRNHAYTVTASFSVLDSGEEEIIWEFEDAVQDIDRFHMIDFIQHSSDFIKIHGEPIDAEKVPAPETELSKSIRKEREEA